MVALQLSKAGYGRPDEILDMPSDLVCLAVEYEMFRNKFEREVYAINERS